MKLIVKTLKGSHFQIQVQPHDTVHDVKKNIESVQGANAYPVSQQMLIYQGKTLLDGTTLEENKVAENSFIVVMLLTSKSFGNSSGAAAAMPISKGLTTPKSPVEASTTSSTIVTNGSSLASTPKSTRSHKALAEGSAPKSLPAPNSIVEASTPKSLPLPTPNSIVEASTSKSPPTPNSIAEAFSPKSLPSPKSRAEASTPKSQPSPEFRAEASTSSLKPVTNATPSASKPAKFPTPKSSAMASSSPSDIVTTGSSRASRQTKIPTPKTPAQASTSPSTTVTNPSPCGSTVSTPKLPAPTRSSSVSESDVVGKVASNLVAPNGLENIIQHIIDMGGGMWDRDTVEIALQASSHNPEIAVDYLYSGIPKQAEVPSHAQPIVATHPKNTSSLCDQPTKAAPLPSSGSNAGPSDTFPPAFLQLGSNAAPIGPLDFLRNSEQFQVLRAMVRANPQVLQPMLQELGKQSPNVMRLIREHQTEFQQLLNEPIEGEEGNILGQFSAVMPQAIQVTPKEHAAIQRLETMGFERSTVLEAYFACNKNEELTANYLLDHVHEFED